MKEVIHEIRLLDNKIELYEKNTEKSFKILYWGLGIIGAIIVLYLTLNGGK